MRLDFESAPPPRVKPRQTVPLVRCNLCHYTADTVTGRCLKPGDRCKVPVYAKDARGRMVGLSIGYCIGTMEKYREETL